MSATPPRVPSWWKPYVARFVQLAYPIGEDLDVAITSWARSISHNAEVGGVENSQHLIGTAWDIAGPDQLEYAARASQRGLIVLDEGDHVHVQLFRAGIVPQWVYSQIAAA